MTGGFDPPLTDGNASGESTVRLPLEHDRNRDLLADWLADTYDVVTGPSTDLAGTDLCLVDDEGFLTTHEAIQSWKEAPPPVRAGRPRHRAAGVRGPRTRGVVGHRRALYDQRSHLPACREVRPRAPTRNPPGATLSLGTTRPTIRPLRAALLARSFTPRPTPPSP